MTKEVDSKEGCTFVAMTKKVKGITVDLSESMASIVHQAFPNAILTLDCFHIMRRCLDALADLGLRFKRDARVEIRRLERNFAGEPSSVLASTLCGQFPSRLHLCSFSFAIS